MRGILAEHLKPFISNVNQLIHQAKIDNIVPTPELARERLAMLSALVTQIPELSYVADQLITANEQSVPVRVYSPAPEQALPVLIYYHGGGHMCGDIELYEPMCRKIAIAGNCIVVSVNYRLAPEFPYPCGLQDAQLVLENINQALNAVRHTEQLMIAGDSAGGAICTSLVMQPATTANRTIAKQILIYPSVDYTLSHPSIDENGQGFFLEKARIQWYFEHYFQHGEEPRSVSPLFNPINQCSPSTLIIVAGCDPLRDEALAYAAKLKQAKVPVQVEHYPNMIHAFMNIEDIVPNECAMLFQQIGTFIQQ